MLLNSISYTLYLIDGSTVMILLPVQEDPAKANITMLQQQLVRERRK